MAQRNAYIVEMRRYDNPTDQASSPYDVELPVTVPEAVIDGATGKALPAMLADIKSQSVTADTAQNVSGQKTFTNSIYANGASTATSQIRNIAYGTSETPIGGNGALYLQYMQNSILSLQINVNGVWRGLSVPSSTKVLVPVQYESDVSFEADGILNPWTGDTLDGSLQGLSYGQNSYGSFITTSPLALSRYSSITMKGRIVTSVLDSIYVGISAGCQGYESPYHDIEVCEEASIDITLALSAPDGKFEIRCAVYGDEGNPQIANASVFFYFDNITISGG